MSTNQAPEEGKVTVTLTVSEARLLADAVREHRMGTQGVTGQKKPDRKTKEAWGHAWTLLGVRNKAVCAMRINAILVEHMTGPTKRKITLEDERLLIHQSDIVNEAATELDKASQVVADYLQRLNF